MEKFETFTSVFGSSHESHYDGRTVDNITRHRRLLEGVLFFDRLLEAIGIQNGMGCNSPSFR